VIRPAALLLLALALIACRDAPSPAKPAEPEIPPQYMNRPPEPDVDADNLLNLAYGASVVSRTGELNPEESAAHGIDGMYLTGWMSAPGAVQEELVFSVLAPSRVLRVGVTAPGAEQLPGAVRFEGSTDGIRWSDLGTVNPTATRERQLIDVAKPFTAQFIRVTFDASLYYISARAFHVLGQEVAPPSAPPFTGCWSSHGTRVHLTQDRARLTGVVESDPPMYFDGGTDNRVGLVMWMQGPNWGYASITRSPDGKHLTRFRFHEEVDSKNLGDAWFGVQCSGSELAGASPPAVSSQAFLERAKHYSVFGLVFDARSQLVADLSSPALDAVVALLQRSPQQRFRITSREFRLDTKESNARQSAARLSSFRSALQSRGIDTSRYELVAAGDQWIGPPIGSRIQAMLASRIDIAAIAP
jgi:hypothetical protein